MFYPQLVAGPIERPQNLLHQFYEKHIVDFERIAHGLQRMLWGFFKKIVIADNLAVYVNQVYAFPHDYSGVTLLVATFFFAIQIYCDFSGYSDIAIGSAEVMGFKLMDNFKTPYLAVSIADFWRRWHISLSTWFRDYVYIPLGGNRVSKSRWYFNIMLTFILSGLWHGANWTYIIWGGIHGFYLSMSYVTEKISGAVLPTLHNSTSLIILLCKRLWVFILVLFAWIFFRANTVSDAWYIVKAGVTSIFHPQGGLNSLFLPLHNSPTPGAVYFSFLCAILVIFFLAEIIDYKRGLLQTLRLQKSLVRYGLYVALILAIMNLGVTQEMRFIYFQF
jgi:D-alanyl-lipoteichoic acid acyltransferase DltB (MBOAT superfamily)